MFLSGCAVCTQFCTQHIEAYLRLRMSLLPRKIITPVVRVEEGEGKGESNPGDDIDFLSLEVEVPVPGHQGVRLPGGFAAVNDRTRRLGGVVSPVSTLENKAQVWAMENRLFTFIENPPSSSLSASRTSFSISFSFFSLCFSLLCSSDLQEKINIKNAILLLQNIPFIWRVGGIPRTTSNSVEGSFQKKKFSWSGLVLVVII